MNHNRRAGDTTRATFPGSRGLRAPASGHTFSSTAPITTVLIANLEKLLGGLRDSALLRYSLGNEWLKCGEPDKAAECLRAAVERDANYSAAWKLLGKALAASGDTAAALAAYTQGIAVAEARGDVQAAREMSIFARRRRGGRLAFGAFRREQHGVDAECIEPGAHRLGLAAVAERTDLDARLDGRRNAFQRQPGVQFFDPARIGKDAGLQGIAGEQPGRRRPPLRRVPVQPA